MLVFKSVIFLDSSYILKSAAHTKKEEITGKARVSRVAPSFPVFPQKALKARISVSQKAGETGGQPIAGFENWKTGKRCTDSENH